jgi:hypothetical protein
MMAELTIIAKLMRTFWQKSHQFWLQITNRNIIFSTELNIVKGL